MSKQLVTETTQARYFELALRNSRINLNDFLKLFKIWSDLNEKDKQNCIDKLG